MIRQTVETRLARVRHDNMSTSALIDSGSEDWSQVGMCHGINTLLDFHLRRATLRAEEITAWYRYAV